MRTVRFTFLDRLILTPIELLPAMKKYPLFALIVLVLFGLTPEGILFRNALQGAYPYLLMGLGAILCGALLTPVLLPYIPSRSFAIKGWLAGLLLMIVASFLFHSITSMRWELLAAAWLFFPAASSYLALQFTGASTFTSMSGVKKELKVGVPLYFVSIVLAAFLVVFFKIREWGIA
jgi:hypothetical protein